MSEAIQIITSKFEKIHDFEKTAEAIKSIIETLVERNPSVDVEFLNEAIEQERHRRNNSEIEKKKVERAMSPIYEYIETLIKAAISDMIYEHGSFQIPVGSYDEDEDENEDNSEYEEIYDGDIFSVKIQKRYELACLDSYKDDRSDQGWFSVKPAGSLRESFKKHGLEINNIEVEFNGVPGDDSVIVTSARDIYDSFGEINMSWNESVTADGLIDLAKELESNPNKNLLIQSIKYPKR